MASSFFRFDIPRVKYLSNSCVRLILFIFPFLRVDLFISKHLDVECAIHIYIKEPNKEKTLIFFII